jgi:hypothetical protein
MSFRAPRRAIRWVKDRIPQLGRIHAAAQQSIYGKASQFCDHAKQSIDVMASSAGRNCEGRAGAAQPTRKGPEARVDTRLVQEQGKHHINGWGTG